jgi:hypothetical protein
LTTDGRPKLPDSPHNEDILIPTTAHGAFSLSTLVYESDRLIEMNRRRIGRENLKFDAQQT